MASKEKAEKIPKQDLLLMPAGTSLERREWLTAVVTALAISLLLLAPYILGYLLSGPDLQYTGLLMNPEDSNSYFAKMLQGFNGDWLYQIPFTTEEHSGAFLGGFYLLMGNLARLVGMSIDMVWHLSRFFFGFLLFLTVFAFISRFLPDRRERWTAYLLTILGSGLGWLLFAAGKTTWLGAFPVDFKMPEAHIFFTALTFPHVALGTTLLMVSFYFLLLALKTNKWRYVLVSALANLAIGIVYPYLIYLVGAASGIFWVWRAIRAKQVLWREAAITALPLIFTAPLYIYYTYTYQVNDVFRTWADQSATKSPPVPHYLVSFGLLLLLALLPALSRRKDKRTRRGTIFLWSWIAGAAILIYFPINPQRRFVQGVQIPLTILAVIGLFDVGLPWLSQSRIFMKLAARPRYSERGLETLILVAIIAFMAISNLYILASTSVTAAVQQPYPFFRTRAEVEAVSWLRENTAAKAAIFSAYETGNYIASHTNSRVWVGHWVETGNWEEKMQAVEKFYSQDKDDAWRADLLQEEGIDYVWHGLLEKEVGNFEPDQADFLLPVFENQEISIYEVMEP